MNKLLCFIKVISSQIIISVFILGVFGGIFYLSKFNFLIYKYSVLFIVFVIVVYWFILFINFTHQEDIKKRLESAYKQIEELENKAYLEKNDLQEYFLMWVHQMKTPITAAMLLANDEDNNWEEKSNEIRQELIYIEDYTNMALNYLKLVNINADFDFESVKLDNILSKLFKKYSVLFIYNHISLKYNKIEDFVITDSRWTSIMIEQILSNAIKYAKNQEITVSYDATNMALSISDTGVGIKKEDLPKIFDKGYSGFNGRLEQKSSGLGLFMVKQISNRLNQKVEVKSIFNQGSTFIIYFNS